MSLIVRILSILTLVVLFGCEKMVEKQQTISMTYDEVIALVNEEEAATTLFYIVLTDVEQTLAEKLSPDSLKINKDTVAKCKLVNINPTNINTYPKTITIDYGTGCNNYLKLNKVGKIIITLNKPYTDSLCIRAIELNNFSVNGNKIEGSINMSYYIDKENFTYSTFLPYVTEGKISLLASFLNGKVILNNGNVVLRQGNNYLLTRKVNGNKINSDMFWLSGKTQVVNSKGIKYVNTIVQSYPLVNNTRYIKTQGGSFSLLIKNPNNSIGKTVIADYIYNKPTISKPYTDSLTLFIDGSKLIKYKLPDL